MILSVIDAFEMGPKCQWMDDVSKGREIPSQYNEPVFPKFLQISILMTKAKSKEQSCRQEQERKEGRLFHVLLWFGLGSLGRLFVIVQFCQCFVLILWSAVCHYTVMSVLLLGFLAACKGLSKLK